MKGKSVTGKHFLAVSTDVVCYLLSLSVFVGVVVLLKSKVFQRIYKERKNKLRKKKYR